MCVGSSGVRYLSGPSGHSPTTPPWLSQRWSWVGSIHGLGRVAFFSTCDGFYSSRRCVMGGLGWVHKLMGWVKKNRPTSISGMRCRVYVTVGYQSVGPSVRPFSVCLSHQSTAAATCGWFAAELGHKQQISTDGRHRACSYRSIAAGT